MILQKSDMNKNALKFIKSCMHQHKVFWTYHVNMRLKERLLSREQIMDSVDSFEIIEEYALDKYLPSYLIYAKCGDEVLHIQIAIDKENDNIRIITSYIPSRDKWENDSKTRRPS